jgi:TDG/mug DNA glycosylase family protein
MRRSVQSNAPSRGFPPVLGERPRVLLLGSLPGRASLAAREYYAQPQNAFWPIMGALCAARPDLDYAERLAALTRAGIALWDVLAEAERPGSLDAAIVAATARVNDIAGLVAENPSIALIGFNGRKAAALFARKVEPVLPRRNVTLVTLPSTSPAFASMRRDEKLSRWRDALAAHIDSVT